MPSLLIIEDDDLFRGALADALTERGYTTIQARDGDEGLQLFRVEPTDLVLTDLVMPNKEGIETIKALRRDHPRLGIIAMSGGASFNSALYLKVAGTLGANRTLQKPFQLTDLLTALEDVLAETGEDEPASP